MSELAQTSVPVAIGPRPPRIAAPAPPAPDRPPRPDLAASLVAFPDPDAARAVVATCRTELSADLGGGPEVADALLVLLVAKALDETEGSAVALVLSGGRRRRQSRGDAKALRRAINHARDWLALVTKEPSWPAPEISDAAALRILEVLAPYSIFLTLDAPGGGPILQALFAEVVAPAGTIDPASAFARPDVATQLLDATAFKARSPRVRSLAVAALDAYGERGRLKARNLDWMRGNYKKGEARLNNYPKLIHVELSTHCNLRCRTCSITRPGRERELKYLSLETLERLRPALPYVSDAKLHGGGEPFMHPQIEQVLEVFREEGVRLNTVTNAVLIRERLGRLIGDTFSSLTVSVDGGDKETYEYVRLRSSWDKLLRGLDNVNRFRNPDLRLIIGVVMLRCNIHQLPDLVRFAHEHGAQELQAAWLVPFHDLPWTATQRLTDDPERTNHFMDEARAVGDELGVSVRIPDNLAVDGPPTEWDGGVESELAGVAHPSERGADRAGAEASTIVAIDHADTYWDLHGTNRVEGHCRLMYDRAMILVDGRVKPCGQSRMVASLGSIHDRSFEACWNSAGYQGLRTTFNGGTLPLTCQSCNFIRSKQLGTARLVYD